MVIELTLPVLLFVLWYCHKRGKEVRLEKERELSEQEVAQLDAHYRAMNPDGIHTTTAPEGASVEEVQEGMREAQAAREAAMESDIVNANPSEISTTVHPAEQTGA